MPAISPALATNRRNAQQPRLPDEQIVARILRGNGQDFEILVRRHQGGLYNFILRMVRDPEEAMDLCQEVFLKVFSCLERFDPQFRFTTWIYRIASNAAIDQIRKRRRAIALSLDAPPHGGLETTRELPGNYPTPDKFLEAHETREKLQLALRDLPEGYRQVLLLRHQSHHSLNEIACITGLPLGTVKNRIFRAREMLRRVLP